MKRNEDYTKGTLRRQMPKTYVDDLFMWGGRVLALMVWAGAVVWIVESL
jgi:hypothetical protein